MDSKYIVERRMLKDVRALQSFLDTNPYPEHRLVQAQQVADGDYALVWESRLSGTDELEVLKKAYRKHVMDDPEIGWDELGEDFRMVLCNIMGHEGFNKFIDEFAADKSASEM
jgi:hypothetical protein